MRPNLVNILADGLHVPYVFIPWLRWGGIVHGFKESRNQRVINNVLLESRPAKKEYLIYGRAIAVKGSVGFPLSIFTSEKFEKMG